MAFWFICKSSFEITFFVFYKLSQIKWLWKEKRKGKTKKKRGKVKKEGWEEEREPEKISAGSCVPPPLIRSRRRCLDWQWGQRTASCPRLTRLASARWSFFSEPHWWLITNFSYTNLLHLPKVMVLLASAPPGNLWGMQILRLHLRRTEPALPGVGPVICV